MINSQQIIIQYPLIEGIKFPVNVVTINQNFFEIANFEIVPSDEINDELFFIPEEEPYNFNFYEYGIESKIFLMNLGFPLYIILGIISLLIVYLILYLANKVLKFKCLSKITNFLSTYLFWNGLIRAFME